MKKTIKLVVIISIVFTLSIVTNAQEWSDQQKEVWELAQKMDDSWANRDLEGYMNCLHEDFIGWFQNDPLPIDKNSLRNWEKHWLSTVKVYRNECKPVSINVIDDVAIVNFYATTIIEDENGKKLVYSKWTEVMKKEDGKWLIIGMHGGNIEVE